MREKEFETINGHKYRCDMMKIREANQTFLTLLSTIGGPAIKAIAAGIDGDTSGIIRMLPAAIVAALQGLEGPVSEQIIESLFNGVYYVGDGREDLGFEMKAWDDNFNDHFHGRSFSMYKVLGWSIQVNYKEFLDEALSLGEDGGMGLKDLVLSSLRTSTSESGQSSPTST